MTMLLENGTYPNGLETKVWSSMIEDDKPIEIDGEYMSYEAFLTVAFLYLIGSELDTEHNDPRPRFVDWAKTVEEVPGWNKDRDKNCKRLQGKDFNRIEVKFPPPEKTAVKFKANVLISGEDFVFVMSYVVENVDLLPEDLRPRFVESVKSMVVENNRLVAKIPFVDVNEMPPYKVGGTILIKGPAPKKPKKNRKGN